MTSVSKTSYSQIFRSTALLGSASVVTIILGVIRTKFMALWLGPSGVGLLALYGTITDLASTVTGLGVTNSGIRHIAEAAGSADRGELALRALNVRRICLVLGCFGAAVLAAASPWVSELTFGNATHTYDIALLGLVVFFGVITGGQTALIQGTRQMNHLSRMKILGVFFGLLISVPIIAFWREDGILATLVCSAAAAFLTAFYYAFKLNLPPVNTPWSGTASDAKNLLSLGIVFVVNGLVAAGMAYLTRLLIVQEMGIAASGHYSAAYALAGLYVGFILQAMGTDFYPRLTAAASNNDAVNRMVNEQAEISLLLAVPGVLATLTLAPWVISLFYSGQFEPAVGVLRWQVLGVLGRVISWPMGFILLARGAKRACVLTELISAGVHVLLLWTCIILWGLPGAGMAFFGLYWFHVVLMLLVCRRETGFKWSACNLRYGALLLPGVALTFLGTSLLSFSAATIVGGVITVACGAVCTKGLLKRAPEQQLARIPFLARWVAR